MPQARTTKKRQKNTDLKRNKFGTIVDLSSNLAKKVDLSSKLAAASHSLVLLGVSSNGRGTSHPDLHGEFYSPNSSACLV